METQWWVALAVLVVIVAIIGYGRSLRTRDRNAQDLWMSAQAQGQAQLPGDRISQREDRRLAGMTADDRAWEQASLERNRESRQARTRRTETSVDTL
jgi:hypothetical protein